MGRSVARERMFLETKNHLWSVFIKLNRAHSILVEPNQLNVAVAIMVRVENVIGKWKGSKSRFFSLLLAPPSEKELEKEVF